MEGTEWQRRWSGLILIFLVAVASNAQEGNTAQPLWQLTLTATPDPTSGIVYGDTVFYLLQDSQLRVFDLDTGEALWQREYSLSNPSAVLPVNADGLIFVPAGRSVQALDEQTGKALWTYPLTESLGEVFSETFNQTGISYSNGYLFIETGNHLTALNANAGERLWQIEKPGIIRHSEVLNDSFVMITSRAILAKGVGHRPHEANDQRAMYSLPTGQPLWTFPGGNYLTKVFQVTERYVDLLTIVPDQGYKQVLRQNIETGETVAVCDLTSRGSYTQLEIEKLGPLWPELPLSPDQYTFYDGYLYVTSSPYSVTQSIYRIPPCDQLSPQVLQAPEKGPFLLENIVYYDLQPFSQVGGPLNGYFLFWKGSDLYKVPVPEESFTHIYHNDVDGSVDLAPTFDELDPPPYERLAAITGQVTKAGLSDKNLVIALLADGTLQVLDFNSLKTVLTATSFAETSEVRVVHDILLVVDSQQGKVDMTAFRLPLGIEKD